jgi:hypothetical protein
MTSVFFVKKAEELNGRAVHNWREEIVKTAAIVGPLIPEWTEATLFNDDVVERLLQNVNFAVLGQRSNELYQLLIVPTSRLYIFHY